MSLEIKNADYKKLAALPITDDQKAVMEEYLKNIKVLEEAHKAVTVARKDCLNFINLLERDTAIYNFHLLNGVGGEWSNVGELVLQNEANDYSNKSTVRMIKFGKKVYKILRGEIK